MSNEFLDKGKEQVPERKWWSKFNKKNISYLLILVPVSFLLFYLMKEKKRTASFLDFYPWKIIIPTSQQF